MDEVLQMQRDGNAYYYHADDQYNVFALTDGTGAVVERYDYGDYGEPEFYTAGGTTRTESALDNPYLFTGRRYDPESGFYYYRNRYYDPRVGQFTTRDPIGIWGDPLNLGNPYAYVGNCPWSLVDPWGLCAEETDHQGARELTGPEREAVDIALDAIRDDDKYSLFADAILENVDLIEAEDMGEDIRGKTPFFTQGGFVLSESLLRQVSENPRAPGRVAVLAGTLVHEYSHTLQYGAGRSPMVQACYQVVGGMLLVGERIMAPLGIGFRDQNGGVWGPLEIGPWRIGIDVENRVLENLLQEMLELRKAKRNPGKVDP